MHLLRPSDTVGLRANVNKYEDARGAMVQWIGHACSVCSPGFDSFDIEFFFLLGGMDLFHESLLFLNCSVPGHLDEGTMSSKKNILSATSKTRLISSI